MPRRQILKKALRVFPQCLFYLLIMSTQLKAEEAPDLLAIELVQDLDQPIPFRVEKPLPAADELIAKVKERLALNAVQMRADLKTKFPDGHTESLSADMRVDWNVESPFLHYKIEDGFGAEQEELTVQLNPGSEEEHSLTYTNFLTQTGSADFNIHQAINGLGMAWSDLMFAYLWWPDPVSVERVERKARGCIIVDLIKPAADEAPYEKVRLWVDEKEYFVIQASAYNEKNELIKEIEGKSLKKFNGNWMIKNIEITTFPDKTKTKVIVRDVKAFDEK